MNTRRFVIAAIVAAAFLIFVFIILFLTVWGPDRSESTEIDRFSDREILIPGADYEIPSVEAEILAPRFQYFIDPEEPLDGDIVDELEPDIGAALREAFSPAVEAELKELLLDE